MDAFKTRRSNGNYIFRRQTALRFRISERNTGIVKRNNRLTPRRLPLLNARKCILCAAESLQFGICFQLRSIFFGCFKLYGTAAIRRILPHDQVAISIRRPRSTCTYGKKQCNNCFFHIHP